MKHEWRVEYSYGAPSEKSELLQFGDLTTSRLVMSAPDCILKLTPKLANRPIVARPVTALEIPAGSTATLYISTILCLEIAVNGTPLLELPAMRLSDTWFGPSTREGELCYAANTRARLDPGRLETLAYKPLTPVVIKNLGVQKLALEKLMVPVPALSLFDRGGIYWTSGVRATIESELNRAKITLDHTLPDAATLVGGPRQSTEKGVWHRALDLFMA